MNAGDGSQDPLDLREEWGGAGYGAGATAPVPRPPSSGYEAPRHPGAPPPPAETGARVRVRGIARDIKMRTEPQSKNEVLTFRVERYDDAGNRLTPVPVEMRRYRRGTLTDGDEVEVAGRSVRGTVRARRIRDLTTASEVRTSAFGWMKWTAVVAAVLVVLGGAYLGITALSGSVSLAGFGGAVPSVPSTALPVPGVATAQPDDGSSFGGGSSGGGGSGGGGGSVVTRDQQPPTTSEAPPVVDPPPSPQGEMPQIVGQTGDAAVNQLKAQGYSVTTVEEPSDQVPAGTVTGTDPAAGSPLPSGAAVTVYVSSGNGAPA